MPGVILPNRVGSFKASNCRPVESSGILHIASANPPSQSKYSAITQCIGATGGSALCFFPKPKSDSTYISANMSTSDSYIIQDASPESSNDQDEIDSLPSSDLSSDLDSEEESDAQKEWEASLQQLELILTMVIVPYAGKYFGRKFAYWSTFHQALLSVESILIILVYRLGKIHDLDVSGGDQIYKQNCIQGCRCGGSCCIIVMTK